MLADPSRDDIDYMRRLAEGAQRAPLVGGRYLVMWGSVVALAYMAQYLILSGIVSAPAWSLLVVWALVFVIAGAAMRLFRGQIGRKPGLGAVGNRVEAIVWTAVGFGIFAYSIGTFLAVMALGASPVLFDIIVAFAFAGYGAAFLVLSVMAEIKWMRLPAIGGLLAAATVPALAGSPLLYAVGAGWILLIAVIPGLVSMRGEPAPLPIQV